MVLACAVVSAQGASAATVSAGDVSVNEATGSSVNATFTVTLSEPAADTVTVGYATQNGTAVVGLDYTARTGTLTFAAGDTSKQVAVPVLGDTLDEDEETFTLVLSGSGLQFDHGVGTATITDDDAAPTINVASGVMQSGLEGTFAGRGQDRTMTFRATLSAPSGRTITVPYETADGSATAAADGTGAGTPGDYVGKTGTLTITPGTMVADAVISVTGDCIEEADETFSVTLSTPVNAAIGVATGVGTIPDDDQALQVCVTDTTVTETDGATTATFALTLSKPSGGPVTVKYETANGTATAGQDYTGFTGAQAKVATFDAGQTTPTQSVTVAVTGDTLDEDDETFRLSLSGATGGASVVAGLGTATIEDDDPPPTISIADAAKAEGTGNSNLVSFAVTLSAPSGKPITVAYTAVDGTAVDGTAATSPADFTRPGQSSTVPNPGPQTLTFTPGATSLTNVASVTTVGDSVDEVDETFGVVLSTPVNTTIVDGTAVGTITDDDGPTASVADITVKEGDAGTTTATLDVALSAVSVQDVSFTYTSANDTAVAPTDFDAVPAGQVLVIDAGAQHGSITVPVRGDTLDEADERFRVTIATPVHASIADGTGIITITDDDATPGVLARDLSVAEGTGGTAVAKLAIFLTAASGRPLQVGYTTQDGSAVAGTDYAAASDTVTFAPGDTSKEVSIPIGTDADVEENETFSVALRYTVGNGAVPAPLVITIVDDDLTAANTPTLSIGDATVRREGDKGTQDAAFTVSLSAAPARAVRVRYRTVAGLATTPQDFTPVQGTLTFPAGTTLQGITVPVAGDTAPESNEDFTVVLSDPVNARLLDASGLGIIINDDVGGGQFTLTPKTLDATSLLCRRGRSCSGLLVRWKKVAVRGTVTVEVAGVVPPAPRPASPRAVAKAPEQQLLPLVTRTFKVTRPGAGQGRVKLGAGPTASGLLRRLRAIKVRQVRVAVSFINLGGARQRTTYLMPLRVTR
ncbi:MAG: retention module-containing protein [Solirubrobacterales bacterium]|nr:retention module-containing protein [Solirubrobacterales bacterium]